MTYRNEINTENFPAQESCNAKFKLQETAVQSSFDFSGSSSHQEEACINNYEEKVKARRERYEQLAAKATSEGATLYNRAREMAQAIPFGQPILFDHHSAGRDINYRNKIHNTFGKSFAAQDKAQHYLRKASGVGNGGVSSDDPKAIEKLRSQLLNAEASQESMKSANRAIRGKKSDEDKLSALIEIGFTLEQAKEAMRPDFAGRIGFPAYALSNNNANISRIKSRIAELENSKTRNTVEKSGNGYIYREDVVENRVMFLFEGKPSEDIRNILKRHSFKWSPGRGAWVRHLNNAGIWASQQVIASLDQA
ncbi:DUF3560 domain-containing protein [Delftia sp. GW456-R20]|uniref:DUF3560 domain-containing protein n=1 Tax=Delftia sp. GW456-R20 TaxID=1827145 RepID=UPI000AB935DA|nr:DUF3560 domain-containing protein [Delftia sp. GW456-R20]